MKNKYIIFILITVTLLPGCKNTTREEQASEKQEIEKEKANEPVTTDTYCFRNEYPFKDNPSMKDIQELKLSIENGKVTGTYNWLPAEKDQRKGKVEGTLHNNTVNAQYIFTQEGREDTTQIKIMLETDKAVVKGENTALGVDASISKINCDEF